MTPRFPAALAAFVFFAVGFLTRAVTSLWYDELFTLWVSSRPWGDLIHQANLDGFTPPLFYALVKALSLAGLQSEDLRVLPLIFAGLAVLLGLSACERLFGSASRTVALLVVPGSAYLFTFSHELRPYSVLLAFAFLFLGQLGGPSSAKSDARSGGAALVASAFSYLGLFMVVLWVIECRRRWSRAWLGIMSLVGLILAAPGLMKAFGLAAARMDSSMAWSEESPALSRILFGMAPVPSGGEIEVISLVFLAALLAAGHRQWPSAPLAFLIRAFAAFAVLLLALHAVVRIGFAPRYFALSMSVLLLLLVGVLSRIGKAGPVIALLLLGMNAIAIFRYLTVLPPPREDWREAMGRLEKRLGAEGVLLAFPFHHAAVAAHAYAPGLKLGGGYTSRSGSLFWYEPPASFRGYSFEDLRRLEDGGEALRRIADVSEMCLLSDEPDVTKTATVFRAFEQLGGAEPFATGDPRLRVLCRKANRPSP